MVVKRTSKVEINRILEGFRNFSGTSSMLSELSGISKKTLLNRNRNGSLLKDFGILLDKEAPMTSKTVEKGVDMVLELTHDTFKTVVNSIHLVHDLPLPFKEWYEETLAFQFHEIGKVRIVAFLDKFWKSSKVSLSVTDFNALMNSFDILTYSSEFKCNVPNDLLKLIEEVFTSHCGGTPTKQQVRAVYNILRLATGGLNTTKKARIESLAGSGKSALCEVASIILEEKYGFDPINILSLSASVASGNRNGKTLAKFIKEVTGTLPSFDELSNLKSSLNILTRSPSFIKKPFVIVDEFSNISAHHQDIVEMLFDKVLYAGDSNQIRTNSCDFGPPLCSLKEQYRFVNSKTTLQKTLSHLIFTGQLSKFKDTLEQNCLDVFQGTLGFVHTSTGVEIRTDYSDALNHILEKELALGEHESLDTVFLGYSKSIVDELNLKLNGGTDLKVGSIVLTRQYIYKGGIQVPTGTRFKIIRANSAESTYTLFNRDLGVVEATASQIELAFAMTSTKAQGRAWDTVVYFGNTAYGQQHYSEGYSSVTRGKVNVRVYLKDNTDDSRLRLLGILKPFVEGKRNDKLNKDLYTYFQEALSSGLSADEITNTINSALRGANKGAIKAVNKVLKEVDAPLIEADTHDSAVPEEKTKNYGYVLEVDGREHPLYPRGAQKCKTREQAQYLLDQHLKTGKYTTGYITEELSGGNRVTIDCDSKEAAAIFERFKDITESYYSEDGEKLHVVFKTTRFFPRRIRAEGLACDILGNWLDGQSLRNEKGNKIYNGKEAIDLPAEVEELIKQLFGV